MGGGARQVEVRLLGPFGVFVDGTEARVSAPRLRDLLGVLALSTGEPVPIEAIGHRVWSEQPPDRLRPTVQTCVSRLRTLLGPEVIRAHPEAYALTLPRENIDVLRFTDELERAHRLPVPADERKATAAALDLWTGTPFSDLTADWFTTAALPGLVERYLAARERRIDLDIAGGVLEPLLVEVRDLTAQYPLREPLWERLIRLLDLTGRHAEALACYDDVRRLIADELGVDPGAELRALYAELLAADAQPDSTPDSGPATDPPVVVPRQLPAENSRVTGREDELKELNELLPAPDEKDPATVIAAICGIGGAGKTSLAIRWAHRVRHLFPDGDLYLNLRGFGPGDAMPTTAALRLLLGGLGLRAERIPSDEAAQSALLRSTLHGRRMLLLLDNARDAEQIRPLLPARGCLVIATSRDRLRSLVVRDGAHRITLGELPPVESERLIRSIAPDTQTDHVSELARSCRHLPLALAIIAEHATGRTPQQVAELLAQLHAEQSVLDTFDGGDEATDLRAIFSWSHRALQGATARLYEHLGLLPVSDFAVPAVAALLGATVTDTRRLLARLADLHLVEDLGNGRFEMHDLVRAHAAELGRLRPDRAEALERLFSWYTHTGYNARLLRDDRGSDRKLPPPAAGITPQQFPDAAAAVQWYNDERQTLAAVIRLAHATGHDRHTYELVESCEGDLSGRDLDLLTELLLLAQDSCTRLDDPLPEAFINNTLGLRYMDQRDDCERAIVHFERSVEIFRAAGLDLQASRGLGNLSVSHDMLGRTDQAIDLAHQALAIKRRLGDERGQANTLGNMAAMYHAAGRLDEAAEAAGEAIRYYRTIQSHRGEGSVLDTLAGIERSRGRYDEALSCHLESVRLHRDLGFPWGEAVVLTNLGHTYRAVGRIAEAKAAWQEALIICDRIHAPRSEDLDREQLVALLSQD
ncbi:tetratricopeptide repeat protein [Kribbella sp. VKM Ac-2566]|uniref:AfsR/SARP family transcriptional regulator n=1 Tax=Kribbella sp. VKM Ac-2566 TaxID=2512218 RepID=UPI001062F4FC|nr:tetratricopeptide repeat protein [Kribbella sp. VKM Ac-2566]TDW86607.1 DNA-binding SARP family transcriptional activator [Kribbella sp. VKM Ac-2566]